MSLPAAWVDKIFTKLTVIYGRDFLGRWEGVSLADVKTDWAHELTGFENWPEAIAHALQNLPAGKPPTVRDFAALCRTAPAPSRPQLPAPQANPERVASELAKLKPIRAAAAGGHDHKAWARRIVAAHDAGEKINACTLRFAREALRMHLQKEGL